MARRKARNASVRTETLIREIERVEAIDDRSPEDERWLGELIKEVDSRLEEEVRRTENAKAKRS